MQEWGVPKELSTGTTHPTAKHQSSHHQTPHQTALLLLQHPTHLTCFLLYITQQAGEEDASPLIRLSWAEYTIFTQILTADKLIASLWVADTGFLIMQPRLLQGRGSGSLCALGDMSPLHTGWDPADKTLDMLFALRAFLNATIACSSQGRCGSRACPSMEQRRFGFGGALPMG